MHKIAYIIGDRFIYLTPIILAIGVLAAVCMFLALNIFSGRKIAGAFAAVPLSIALSLLLGRIIYWCCMPGSFASLGQALTTFSVEGYAITGVVIGCVLAACLVRLLGLSKNLPAMLDTMSLAGLFGMAVGRLNHYFNTADRMVAVATADTKLPLAESVFLLQAIVCAALFAILLAFFLIWGRKAPGNTCLLAGLFHGAAQLVLDGKRYDALLVPGISGVTLAQLGGILLVLTSLTVFIMRPIKRLLDRGIKTKK